MTVTGTFIRKPLHAKAKALARKQNRTLKDFVSSCLSRFVIEIEQTEKLPELPPDDMLVADRSQNEMVAVEPDIYRRASFQAAKHRLFMRDLVIMAVLRGVEHPDTVPPPARTKGRRKQIYLDGNLLAAVRAVAERKGLKAPDLIELLLQTVVSEPAVLEAFDLSPLRTATAAQLAHAEVAVSRLGLPTGRRLRVRRASKA